MGEENSTPATFAVIADIHGNRWALEVVLRDIERRGVQQIINLGDHLTGPLDPVGTAEILLGCEMVNVCGNDDRELFASEEQRSRAQKFTRALLAPSHVEWLHSLADSTVVADEIFVCHGDLFDAAYLLEEVSTQGVFLRRTRDIVASVAAIPQSVILSGHSHVARAVTLPEGKLLVNPGSVGMQAYTMDTPVAHAMEAGSPHARYALLKWEQNGWQVEHILLPYAWEDAAASARENGREDWAEWISTGRAR